jgi:hypothetical protein
VLKQQPWPLLLPQLPTLLPVLMLVAAAAAVGRDAASCCGLWLFQPLLGPHSYETKMLKPMAMQATATQGESRSPAAAAAVANPKQWQQQHGSEQGRGNVRY